MTRFLMLVLALVIMIPFSGANCQVPFIMVFFDDEGTVGARECPAETMVDTFSVYAFNLNMWMERIEYRIEYSPAVNFCGDILEGRIRIVGNSDYGIEITYREPVEAGAKFLLQRSCVVWFCTDCASYLDTYNFVFPNPNTGRLGVTRHPDLVFINVMGWPSTTCPWTLPVKQSTWGQVKSLYKR